VVSSTVLGFEGVCRLTGSSLMSFSFSFDHIDRGNEIEIGEDCRLIDAIKRLDGADVLFWNNSNGPGAQSVHFRHGHSCG
jgi:hypothetical protein